MTVDIGTMNGLFEQNELDLGLPGMQLPTTITKRDGRQVPFDIERIENALKRCFASFGRRPHTHVAELGQRVINIIAAKHPTGTAPSVEEVQDTVEEVLQAAGEFEAAKRYILYRAEHAKQREERPVPADVRQAFADSDQYFPTALQKFQFFDKYSRFNYDLGRRETRIETVDRSVNYMHELAGDRLPSERAGVGPLPLRTMLDFARARVLACQGSFLRSIDAHDIMCAVGNAAVSGGVLSTVVAAV